MIKHISPISGIATSARYIATAGYDNQVILWDKKVKRSIAKANHDHLANSVCFSRDEKILVSCSSDHTARVYRIPDMQLLSVLAEHEDDVEMAAISTDSKLIATASRDGRVRLYSINGVLLKTFLGHGADVISVCFSADEKNLITSSDDGTIRKWNIEDGQESDCISFDGVETDTLAITKNGEIFAGNDEGELIYINAKGEMKKLKAHTVGIKRIIYDDVSEQIASVSYDRTCKIWRKDDKSNIDLQDMFALPSVIWPRSCAFVDSKRLVFGTFGSTYSEYDIESKKWNLDFVEDTLGKNAVVEFQGDTYSVGDAGVIMKNNHPNVRLNTLCNFLTPFAGTLIAGGQIGIIYNALTGAVIYDAKSPLNCGVSFEFKNRQYCAIGTYTGDLVILESRNSEIKYVKTRRLHKNAIKGVTASEEKVFSVSANREAVCIDISELLEGDGCVAWRDEARHTKIANGCVFVSGDRFASVSRDRYLRIWDSESVEEVQTPHTRSVKCVSYNPNSNVIATGSYGGEIALYDQTKKSWIKTLRPTTFGISSVCVSNNGFKASSYDGNIYEIQID